MDRYQLIESYINNLLSKEEKSAFESRLASEPELKKDLEYHAAMKASFDHLLEEDIRGEINRIKKGTTDVSAKTVKMTWMRWVAAASVLLLMVGGKWMAPISSADAIAEYYKPPVLDISRSDVELQPVIRDFSQAHNEMKEGDYLKALEMFGQVDLPDGHKMSNGLEWYIALCHLDNDKAKAIEILQNISRTKNHKYAKNASKLLEDLHWFGRY